MTTKTHAILTVNGHFAGQALLTDDYQMGCIKAEAKHQRDKGHAVTLRKGLGVNQFTAVCGCCGTVVPFAKETENTPWDDNSIPECGDCGAQAGSWNAKTGIIYSWMSAAFMEEANAWYDEQMMDSF